MTSEPTTTTTNGKRSRGKPWTAEHEAQLVAVHDQLGDVLAMSRKRSNPMTTLDVYGMIGRELDPPRTGKAVSIRLSKIQARDAQPAQPAAAPEPTNGNGARQLPLANNPIWDRLDEIRDLLLGIVDRMDARLSK